MGDLTSNISRKEMACSCGCVRILVKSGCRCPKHNRLIGGAENSYHLYAKGIDYVVQTWNGQEWITISASELARYLDKKYPEKYGIIIYWSGRVHFDIRQTKYRKRM